MVVDHRCRGVGSRLRMLPAVVVDNWGERRLRRSFRRADFGLRIPLKPKTVHMLHDHNHGLGLLPAGELGPPAVMESEEGAISQALRRSFRHVDDEILAGARQEGARDGATALLVLRLSDTLYAAHAGGYCRVEEVRGCRSGVVLRGAWGSREHAVRKTRRVAYGLCCGKLGRKEGGELGVREPGAGSGAGVCGGQLWLQVLPCWRGVTHMTRFA